MPDYRRSSTPGATYFFTLVTYRRHKILCNDEIRVALRHAIRTAQTRWSFTIEAWVLMPDHLHTIWTLPPDDADYSKRWSMIKRLVTKSVGAVTGAHGAPYSCVGCTPRVFAPRHAVRTNSLSESRKKRREGGIWQRRFWEHQVLDASDLNRCLDYLHWNPVKHGHVSQVADWPFSTFHRFVRQERYPQDWGGGAVVNLDQKIFGE